MTATSLFSSIIWILFGYLMPGFYSFKAIESKDFKRLTRLIIFWIVIAQFSALEPFIDFFISWFPLYHEIKLLCILFLLFPDGRGATYFYKTFTKPFFLENESKIDQVLIDLRTNLTAASAEAVKASVVVFRQAMVEVIKQAQILYLQQGTELKNERAFSVGSNLSKEFDQQKLVELSENQIEEKQPLFPTPSRSIEAETSARISQTPSVSSLPGNLQPSQPAIESQEKNLPPQEPPRAKPTVEEKEIKIKQEVPVEEPPIPQTNNEDQKDYEAIVKNWVWEIEHFDDFDDTASIQSSIFSNPLDVIFAQHTIPPTQMIHDEPPEPNEMTREIQDEPKTELARKSTKSKSKTQKKEVGKSDSLSKYWFW